MICLLGDSIRTRGMRSRLRLPHSSTREASTRRSRRSSCHAPAVARRSRMRERDGAAAPFPCIHPLIRCLVVVHDAVVLFVLLAFLRVLGALVSLVVAAVTVLVTVV